MTKNWGRWPEASERGALNLIDGVAWKRAAATVRLGRSVSLGGLVSSDGPRAGFRTPVQHYFTRHGGDYAAGLGERPGYGYADDVVVLPCHGTTHIDALSHVWQEHEMWDGQSASNVTSRGSTFAGIESVGPIVTRGLFVDVAAICEPGRPIPVEAIERVLDDAGVTPESGDALIVRTGWLADWTAGRADPQAWPGLDTDITPWVDAHDIALVGADNISVEVQPSRDPECALPLHIELIRDRGVFLVELLDLEELSTQGVVEFMLTLAPLRIVGASGSPVAPIATF